MADKKEVAPVTPTTPPVESTALAPASQEVDLATFDYSSLGDIVPSTSKPKNIDPNDLAGTEDIGKDDIRLPRLAIAQGLSPQMIPNDGKYIKGLELFTMFNDVTTEIYGNGPLVVVPVARQITRIEFDPDNQNVPLDREVPAGDPRLSWRKKAGKDGEDLPPLATEFHEFICMLLKKGSVPEPIVVSIKTTNKHMREAATLWDTFIKLRGTAIYRGMYHITSKGVSGKTKDGKDTNFGVFIVKNAGFLPTDTPAGRVLLDMAKDFHESLQGKTIVVNREGTPDDGTSFDTAAMDAQTAKERGQTEM